MFLFLTVFLLILNFFLLFFFQATAIALSSAAPANGDNGKYNVSGRNDGKYHPIDDGKYRPRSNDEGIISKMVYNFPP